MKQLLVAVCALLITVLVNAQNENGTTTTPQPLPQKIRVGAQVSLLLDANIDGFALWGAGYYEPSMFIEKNDGQQLHNQFLAEAGVGVNLNGFSILLGGGKKWYYAESISGGKPNTRSRLVGTVRLETKPVGAAFRVLLPSNTTQTKVYGTQFEGMLTYNFGGDAKPVKIGVFASQDGNCTILGLHLGAQIMPQKKSYRRSSHKRPRIRLCEGC